MRSKIFLSLVLAFGLVGTANSTIYFGGKKIISAGRVTTDSLVLEDPDAGTNTITITAPTSLSTDYSLIFPIDDGLLDEVLTTDGSGVLTWQAAGGMVTKTFQNVYDDDVSDASFDLDASGFFRVRDNAGNNIISVEESTDSIQYGANGTDYLDIRDSGALTSFTSLGQNFLFTTSGVTPGELQLAAGTSQGLVKVRNFSAGTGASLQLQASGHAQAGILRLDKDRAFFFLADSGDMSVGFTGLAGDNGHQIVIRGSGLNAGQQAELVFGTNASTPKQGLLSALVNDTSSPKTLVRVQPEATATFTDADSAYFEFFNGSVVVSKILRSGALTGPPGKLHVESEKDSEDMNNNSTLSEHVFADFDSAATITSVEFLPDLALVANDTNYATITVYRRDSSGGTQTTIVAATTQTTGTGSWTAFDSVDFGTLAVTALAVDEVVTWEITKNGTGIKVPSGTLKVNYTND